ncbi:MAG: acetamidase/formamidase family protein [Anaerolineae bacterium]|jgi:amidase
MIRVSKDHSTYDFSPDNPPAIRVKPGTTLVLETLDALDGQIQSDSDSAEKIDLGHVNSATGPVYVEGVEPGDTLVAEILDIELATQGAALIIPGFGALQEDIPGPYTKVFQIEDDVMRFGDKVRLPLKPMIGTIGVAPLELVPTLSLGEHGGNLDTTAVTSGATLYVPVFVEGALFGAGDVHSTQGDGEVCGTGIEIGSELTIRLDVRKDFPIERPRLENANEWMTIGVGESLEEAIRFSLLDMIAWLQDMHNLSREEAYVLISLAGDVRIGQIVDPMVSVRTVVPKQVFA